MNSRASVVVLLFVLIGVFIFMIVDTKKERLEDNNIEISTDVNQNNIEKKQEHDSSKMESETKTEIDNKNIEIIDDFAEEKSLSNQENDNIKNTAKDFVKAYCNFSEGVNPKTRLESVRSLMTNSLYEELNKIIDVETDLATEYYVYRNLNKIVIHTIIKKDDKISVGVSTFSDYLNSDLSTQIEDAPQDYTLTLTKDNGEWIIESCVENFK